MKYLSKNKELVAVERSRRRQVSTAFEIPSQYYFGIERVERMRYGVIASVSCFREGLKLPMTSLHTSATTHCL